MQVQLRLRRSYELGNKFDFDESIPPHCAVAAYSLFVVDAIELSRRLNDAPNQKESLRRLRQNLRKAVMTPLPCSYEKLRGAVPCTLRVAAFSTLLRVLPPQSSRSKQRGMDWATRHGLRSNTRPADWDLNDLMFALESLVVHWERLSKLAWSSPAPLSFLRKDGGAYFLLLWHQCARFLSMTTPQDIAEYMNAGKFTLPYANVPSADSGESVVALHTNTLAQMCEIWRFVRYERFFPFDEWEVVPASTQEEHQRIFLQVFHLEIRQLEVDKFRELLRLRLAARFLCPADTETYYHLKPGSRGKGFDPDSVINERHTLNLPGYLQKVASGWTFEQMLGDPMVRDELFRAMADSGCRSKCGSNFTTKFFEQPGPPTDSVARSANVPYLKRYGHAFVLVHRGKGKTPPLPFASAFCAWISVLKRNSIVPYGVRFDTLFPLFENAT